MTVVQIDLDAMRVLISALDWAIRVAPDDTAAVRRRLDQVLLSYPAAARWVEGGDAIWRLMQIVADCRQRLSLAQMIAASTPRIGPVIAMDDTYAEYLPDDYAYRDPPHDLVDTIISKLSAADPDTKMTSEQIREAADTIARMAFNAPEPYRTLFLKHLPELSLSDVTTGSKQYYQNDVVHIDIDGLLTDVPTACHTFFHEYGHYIDDEEKGYGFMSTSYDYAMDGQTNNIQGWLGVDTMNTLTRIIAAQGFTDDPDQTERILDAALGGTAGLLQGWVGQTGPGFEQDGYPRGSTDPGSDADVFRRLAEYCDSPRLFGNTTARTASDLIGEETRNSVNGKYGHSTVEYWDRSPTTQGAKEFWAGFYGDTMVYYSQLAELAAPDTVPGTTPTETVFGQTSLDVTTRVFPNASAAAQSMAERMNS